MKNFLLTFVLFIILIACSVFAFSGTVYYLAEKRLNRVYDLNIRPIKTGKGQPDIVKGQHLFESVALCAECHGENLAGKVLLDDRITGSITAPNLTKGTGSTTTEYVETDWIRAIRHGIGRDGKSLLKMPSHIYFYLSDTDLLSIAKYIESVEPVDNELPSSEIAIPARFLILIGKEPLLIAETINHKAPRPIASQEGVSTEYGRYLTIIGRCFDCHGQDLRGVLPTVFQPNIPAAPDISPAGGGKWTDDEFFKIMREGIKADGSTVELSMPWKLTAGMTDDELLAILLYLKTFPGKAADIPTDDAGEEEIEEIEETKKPEEIKTSDK